MIDNNPEKSIKKFKKLYDYYRDSEYADDAIMKISVDYRKPIGNGILTCLNMVQAKKRSKKGAEAAEAVKSVLSQ